MCDPEVAPISGVLCTTYATRAHVWPTLYNYNTGKVDKNSLAPEADTRSANPRTSRILSYIYNQRKISGGRRSRPNYSRHRKYFQYTCRKLIPDEGQKNFDVSHRSHTGVTVVEIFKLSLKGSSYLDSECIRYTGRCTNPYARRFKADSYELKEILCPQLQLEIPWAWRTMTRSEKYQS